MLHRVVGVGLVAALCSVSSLVFAQSSSQELENAVAETAAGLGGERGAAITRRAGTLQEGQNRDLPVALRPSQCIVAVARSAPAISNIDVQLLRGRTVLTRDVEAGTSASVSFCAGARAEHLRVRVTAFRGRGDFAVGVFPSTAATTASSTAATTAPSDAPANGSLTDRVSARAREVAADLQAVTPAARETLTQGQRIERDLALVPGRCYRVVTASESTVNDVDLAVSAPSGGELQRDNTHDGAPTLGVAQPFCPATPGTHRLSIRMVQGGGAVGWQLLGTVVGTSPAGASTRAAATFAVGGDGSDFVASRIRARHQAAGEGGRPVNALVTGELTTSLSRDFEVDVEAGRCYVVLGAGVPSVRELDLKVFDGLGNELSRDGERDAFPKARFCPTLAGRFRVNVRMFQGYGSYGVQVFQVP